MRRSILWGASLILTGIVLWWGSQLSTQAEHRLPATGYNPAESHVGVARDNVSDDTPDHPGSEKAQRDRSPDRPVGDLTPDGTHDFDSRDATVDNTPDRAAANREGATFKDLDPDCGNGPGDGNCGNSPNSGDGRADNFGAGESVSDNTPDRPIALNRPLDDVNDGLPDAEWKDRFILRKGTGNDTIGDRVGLRDCAAVDVAVGECDDAFDDHPNAGGKNNVDGITERDRVLQAPGARDRVGPDTVPDGVADRVRGTGDNERRLGGNPDGDRLGGQGDGVSDRVLATNSDNRPDGSQDRDNNRDQGQFDHNIASRDAYSFGAGDNVHDDKADEGSLGYASVGSRGGSGGGGGCSLVGTRTATPGSDLAYLLILLMPLAVVAIRRRWSQR